MRLHGPRWRVHWSASSLLHDSRFVGMVVIDHSSIKIIVVTTFRSSKVMQLLPNMPHLSVITLFTFNTGLPTTRVGVEHELVPD